MGEQRAAILADEVKHDLLYRRSPQAAVHLQSADHLAAKNPDVVAVPPQSRARQRLGQQVAQERSEVLDQPHAMRNVAGFIRPAASPPIEVRTVSPQGVGGRLLIWQTGTRSGNSLGACCLEADLPAEPASALFQLRL